MAWVKKLLPAYLQENVVFTRVFGTGGVEGKETVNSTPYVHIALIAAAEAGKEEVVEALLAVGAHPLFYVPENREFPTLSACTPLSAAVHSGQNACVHELRVALRRGGQLTMPQQTACYSEVVVLFHVTHALPRF